MGFLSPFVVSLRLPVGGVPCGWLQSTGSTARGDLKVVVRTPAQKAETNSGRCLVVCYWQRMWVATVYLKVFSVMTSFHRQFNNMAVPDSFIQVVRIICYPHQLVGAVKHFLIFYLKSFNKIHPLSSFVHFSTSILLRRISVQMNGQTRKDEGEPL